MSRRKQSNPKPLKRKAEEEELLELAERVCLPREELCLGEAEEESEDEESRLHPGSSVEGVSVQAAKKLSEGRQFGPYQAQIIAPQDDHHSLTDGHQILRTNDQNGRPVKVFLKESGARWLKLIKSSSAYHSANFSVYTHGDHVWCRVKRDLDIETELRSAYEGEAKYSRSSPSEPITSPIPGNKFAKIRRLSVAAAVSPESSVNGGENALSPKKELEERAESPKNFRRSPTPAAANRDIVVASSSSILVNGDDVKRERLSPGPDSPSSRTAGPHNDDEAAVAGGQTQPEFIKVPVSEESSYPETTGLPAFPPYGYVPPQAPPGGFVYVPFLSGQQMSPRPSSVSSVSSDQNEPKTIKAGFNCVPCGITFSSLRTLQAHQSYYCAHRTINLKNRNEDANNEDSPGRPKSRNHYSPRTRRNNVTDDRSRGGTVTAGEDLTVSDASNASEMASISGGNNGERKSFNKSTSNNKTYFCNFCDYVTDRKGGLTRHVRTHAETLTAPSSPDRAVSPGGASKDNPSERYCTNCEIQFASRKTYQVHKALYCGTRHVHKSVTPGPVPPSAALSPPTLPGTSSQPNIYEERLPPPPRIAKNKNAPIVVPQPISPNSLPSTGIDPKTGLVFGHPFYAAVSTSPLILVPCSYLPGRGITPAAGGGIVLPNGTASDDILSMSPVPAFAVLPNPNARSDAANVLGLGTTPKVRPITPKSETDVKVGESSNAAVDKPLDLSLRKKGETSPPPPPSHISEPKVAVVLPTNQAAFGIPPIPVASAGPSTDHHSNQGVLVKQGTSRCKECNIVFYKHENYLVHKRMYCASRQNRDKRSSASSPENDRTSPKNGGNDLNHPAKTGKRRESNSPARSSESSPGHSPKSIINVKCPSPGTNASPLSAANPTVGIVGPQAIYQLFYCFACHIKFTSLDNLRAHQTYYCPKRQITVPPPSTDSSPGSPRGPETGLRCPKCKHCFPTEETLRCHPCGSQRKCPYCEVNCPTLSAAQRHLVTHTGVKAFRCTICGYKGHTLRGMRTHIRIHLESGCSTPEENYIVCVGEDGVTVGKTRRLSNSTSPKDGVTPTNRDNSNSESNPTTTGAGIISPGSITPNLDENPDSSSSQGTGGATVQDVQHWCQFCGYTSSYKGNVVRHIKLVHRDIVLTPTNPGIVGAAPSGLVFDKATSDNIQPAPTLRVDRESSDIPVSLVVKKETNLNGTDSEHSNDSRLSDNTDKIETGSRESTPEETSRRQSSPVNSVIKKEMSDRATNSSSSCSNSNSNPGALSPREQTSSNENVGGVAGKKIGSKYCKTCDISFKHLSNFVAHKKFYCSPQNNDTVIDVATTETPTNTTRDATRTTTV